MGILSNMKKKKKTAKKLFEVLKSVKTTHIANVCENNWQTLQLRCLCYKNEDFPTTKPIGKKSLLTTMVTNYSLVIGQRLDDGADQLCFLLKIEVIAMNILLCCMFLEISIYEIRIQANRQTVRASELFNTQDIFFILFSKKKYLKIKNNMRLTVCLGWVLNKTVKSASC